MKLFLVLILLTLFSCSQPSNENAVHIVPLRTPPKSKNNPNEPPPPPPIQVYYQSSNFIIDSTGQVYYYGQQQYGWYCGIEWDTPREFIGLKPSDIVRVPDNSLADFIRLNVLSQDRDERGVAIASLKDTVVSSGLSTIIHLLSDTSNKVRWNFRKATQEESTVLSHKQQNKKYYWTDVNWDSTKTFFPRGPDEISQYTMPEAEQE